VYSSLEETHRKAKDATGSRTSDLAIAIPTPCLYAAKPSYQFYHNV